MPPIYTWEDERTGKSVEVIRDFDKYEVAPTEEEATGAGLENKEYQLALWKRVIGKGLRVVKGDNWGGGKGYW
jgi:predicted nucleic acid-binding Zn ribbon protein